MATSLENAAPAVQADAWTGQADNALMTAPDSAPLPLAQPMAAGGGRVTAEASKQAAQVQSHWADADNVKSQLQPRSREAAAKKETEPASAQDAAAKKIDGYPKVVQIGSEQVQVASPEEEHEAQQIVADIKATYGIEVSSQKGIDAIKANYSAVPKTVTDKLQTKLWEMKELRALQRALSHFAPILGTQRQTSSRKGEGQEISSVSKVDQAIDKPTTAGQLDTTTLGEYFRASAQRSSTFVTASSRLST